MKAHELVLVPGNNLRSDCVSQETGLLIASDGHNKQLVLDLPFLGLDFAWLAMPLQRLATKVKADSWTNYQVHSVSELLSAAFPTFPLPKHLVKGTRAKAASCWEGKGPRLLIHWCGAKSLQTFPEHCLWM